MHLQEGQGLGKSEQGIVKALEVEKTSKRGGRIVLERDESPPPMGVAPPGGMMGVPPAMPPPMFPPPAAQAAKPDNNIANILKNPSKVALLRVSDFFW